MGSFSLIHWIILGVVILLLFGGNRFSAMMSDVAKGLKNFKQGLSEDDKPGDGQQRNDPRQLPPQSREPIDVTPQRTPEPVPPSPPGPTATPAAPPPSSDEPNRQ